MTRQDHANVIALPLWQARRDMAPAERVRGIPSFDQMFPSSDGGVEGHAECSATGASPTDTPCAAEQVLKPCPSEAFHEDSALGPYDFDVMQAALRDVWRTA